MQERRNSIAIALELRLIALTHRYRLRTLRLRLPSKLRYFQYVEVEQPCIPHQRKTGKISLWQSTNFAIYDNGRALCGLKFGSQTNWLYVSLYGIYVFRFCIFDKLKRTCFLIILLPNGLLSTSRRYLVNHRDSWYWESFVRRSKYGIYGIWKQKVLKLRPQFVVSRFTTKAVSRRRIHARHQ